MPTDLLTALAGGAAIGLLSAAAAAAGILAVPHRITAETQRADHHAREGLAAHLISPRRDFASMRIAGARYLDIAWMARRSPTLEHAEDLGAVAGERLGLIMGHVAARVGTLAAGCLMGAGRPHEWLWWLAGGVVAGYALDATGHRVGVRVGRAAGAAYARAARRGR